MRDLLDHHLAPAAGVVLALALVAALTQLTRPELAGAERRGATTRVPVVATSAVCPEPSSQSATSTLALAGSGKSGGSGGVRIRDVRHVSQGGQDGQQGQGGDQQGQGSGQQQDQQQRPRRVTPITVSQSKPWYRETKEQTLPQAARASGSMAAGFEMEQVSRATSGSHRGLAGVRCAKPDNSFWFVASGPAGEAAATLYLTNIDDTPASVSLSAYGPQGALNANEGRAVRVRPHQQVRVSVDDFAGSSPILALRVSTSIGRVSAAMRSTGPGGSGNDWVPVAASPAKKVVIPGVPKGEGGRKLVIAAPGNRVATVGMKVLSAEGPYVPEGRDTVQVPAQSALSVDLSAGMSGRSGAVMLTSNVPIVAGVAVSTDDSSGLPATGGGSEVAFAAGVPPLHGSSVVAYNRADDDMAALLLLSALPKRAANVQVVTVSSSGARGKPKNVKVDGGNTVAVELSPPSEGASTFAAIVKPKPGAEPVYGARLLREDTSGGSLVTLLPLRTSPTHVTVPRVGESLLASLRS